MKRTVNEPEIFAVVARRRDDRPRIGDSKVRWNDAADHHFKRDSHTVVEHDKAGMYYTRDKVDLIPRAEIDDRNEAIAESIAPVRAMAGGPRSSVWPLQSGAAQSPFTGRDRVQAPPTVPNRVIAPTLAPAARTGRACVTDSPAHNPTRGPVPTLRFASEARRTRLASQCAAPVLNEEEGATERPLRDGLQDAPQSLPTPVPVSPSPEALERARERAREAQKVVDLRRVAILQWEETQKLLESDRQRVRVSTVPAPRSLPRRPSQTAPTPRHGIEGAVSSSGRDLDPGRKR